MLALTISPFLVIDDNTIRAYIKVVNIISFSIHGCKASPEFVMWELNFLIGLKYQDLTKYEKFENN
jgi:hypothetical protein